MIDRQKMSSYLKHQSFKLDMMTSTYDYLVNAFNITIKTQIQH